MFKKLFIGLAPLLAIAAFAVMPVAAQAENQHWYRNGVIIPENLATPFVWWGNKVNINQVDQFGHEVNCRGVGGGTIENPGIGGPGEPGRGSMTAAAFYECKAPQCEKEILEKFGLEGRETVEAANMPASINGHPERRMVGWNMRLEESEIAGVFSVRLKIGEPFGGFKTPSPPGAIRLKERCEILPSEEAGGEAILETELNPEIGIAKGGNLNGTTPGKPSTFKFAGASTGTLESLFAGKTTYNTGSVKYLGYNEQEVITVKP
jgi:hypothetical protein